MLVAASLSLSLMGCSPSGNAQLRVIERHIPDPPDYLRRVQVKDPVLGEDPYDIAARERVGRVQANRIITNTRFTWLKMQAEYAKETSP